MIADSLSRQNQIFPSEWSLHLSIVQKVLRIWDFPMLDLFATRRFRKMPLYVSPVPDDQVWAEDALSIDWTSLQAYAYPPTSIMPKVLEKVLMENCLPVLIAPAWPTQSWFSLLLEMSVDHPLRLPLSPKLLKQTDKPFFHSNPGHLKHHA